MGFFRKIEDHVVITLDHGRLILAIIGAFLFISLVFLLGVLVGKALWGYSAEMALRQQTEWPRPAPRVEEKPVGNPQYTFYEEVKKTTDTVTAPPEMKMKSLEETPVPTAVRPTAPLPPMPVAQREEPAPQAAERAPEREPATVKSEKREEARPKPAAPPLAASKPIPPPPVPAAKSAPPPAATPAKDGGFSVQIESYQEKSKAEAAKRKLASRGITTSLEPSTVGGATWYRLQVNGFATREAAEKYRKDVLKPKGFNGYIISR